MDRPFSANSPYSTTSTQRLSSYRGAGGSRTDTVTGRHDDRLGHRSYLDGDSYETRDPYSAGDREPVDYPDFGDSPDPYENRFAPRYRRNRHIDNEYRDGSAGYGADLPDPDLDTRGLGPTDLHDTDLHDTDLEDDRHDPEITFYDEAAIDRRWMWIAGTAGAILLVALICTGVILGGGDSGTVTATVDAPPTTTAAPAATAAPPAPTALPKETMTTVTPTAPPSPTATAAPAPTVAVPPPAPTPDPRTITYTVTGNRQLIDLVTVIYTNQQGALQTDVNVALPWSKTVVLDPGVELGSVTATSVAGQLNCSITDAAGTPIVSQAANSMITTCTK